MLKSGCIKLLLCFGIIVHSHCRNDSPKLVIAAASNFSHVLPEIVSEFEKVHSFDVEVVYSSSGNLTTQIIHGSPYHVFLCADLQFVESLQNHYNHRLDHEEINQGSVWLWISSNADFDSLNDLKRVSIRNIGMANPKIAAYATAARECLITMNLHADLRQKYRYVQSINQVNNLILSGAVDAAFVSNSARYHNKLNNSGKWIDLKNECDVLVSNYAVVLSDSPQFEESKIFIDFLKTDISQKIFTKFGYEINH